MSHDCRVTSHMTVPPTSLLKAVEVFEARLGPPPNTRLIMAVDNRLRKQTQDQHTRLQKVHTIITLFK